MTTKARLFAKFERLFEPLTTDDIIKLIVEHFNTNELYGFLEYCQEEVETTINNAENEE